MAELTSQARIGYAKACAAMMEYRRMRANSVAEALARSGKRELPLIREVDAAEQDLINAYQIRWDGVCVKSGPNSKYNLRRNSLVPHPTQAMGAAIAPQQVAAQLSEYEKTLTYERMPLLAASRWQQYITERDAVSQLLGIANAARQSVLDKVRQAVEANAGKLSLVFKADAITVQSLLNSLEASLPAGVADRAGDLVGAPRTRSAFELQLGFVADHPHQLLQHSSPPRCIDIAPAITPLVVDLHAAGGFVTDSASLLQSAIVRLLATTPAGSLRVQVFDRQTYGRVVDYLLDLDDAAQRQVVVGPIATTAGDLRGMLEEVERHIGFITQKYLGGKHATLRDYNRSAGDITEASRLLVLAGYPDGFTRSDGGLDDDLDEQLLRIIKAGPAAGVYPLILGTQPISGAPSGLPWFLDGRNSSSTWPPPMANLARPFGRIPMPPPPSVDALRASGARSLFGLEPSIAWHPARALDVRVVKQVMARLSADLRAAPARKVTPAGVAALGKTTGARVDPNAPSTWWKLSSSAGVEAPVGRRGAGDVQTIQIESSVDHNGLLVGGRSRSGKSTFLHALITELARRYSPDELQFCLIDLKNGVEFAAYRRLPHARIVGLEAGTEFGVAVLDSLITEMKERTVLFDNATVSNLRDYRAKTGKVLPRILVVIDEFMFAFERQGSVNQAFGTVLQRVIKQGGAYGIHLVLATQTISQGVDVPRDALREIPMRVALQCDEAASRLLLSDANPAAALLEHPGEALYNGGNGAPSANTPFQSTYVDVGAATDVSAQLAAKAVADRMGVSPRVFNTRQRAPFPTTITLALAATHPNGVLHVPLGLPFGLGSPIAAKLSRAPGGNLLALVPLDTGAAIAAGGLTVALNPASRAVLLDFGGLGTRNAAAVDQLLAGPNQPLGVISRPLGRNQADTLAEIELLVITRQSASLFRAPAVLLLLLSIEQGGILKDGSASLRSLQQILADGPAVGVHTMIITEGLSTFERRVGSYALDDFDHRLVGTVSADVGIRVIDTTETSDLSDTKLRYYDRSRGLLRHVLAFESPPATIWGKS